LYRYAPPIIHRDLKSPNLMVDRYFRVKVGDFNLSRVAVASVNTGSKGGAAAGVGSPVYSMVGRLNQVDFSFDP
jgi:serine/threonine protein kinase